MVSSALRLKRLSWALISFVVPERQTPINESLPDQSPLECKKGEHMETYSKHHAFPWPPLLGCCLGRQ